MPMSAKVSGAWQTVVTLYAKTGGVWRASSGSVKTGGVWRNFGVSVTVSGATNLYTASGGSTTTPLSASGSGITSYSWSIVGTTGLSTWSLVGSTTSSSVTLSLDSNSLGTCTVRCTVNGGAAFDDHTVTANII